MTLQDWKLSQIDLANARLDHYKAVMESLEDEGVDPWDPVYTLLANKSWLEYYRIEIMFFDDRRLYYSSDHDLLWN